MEKDIKKYEVVLNSSINIMRNFILLGIAIFSFIIYFNNIYTIGRVWNICFLFPISLIFISSIILVSICTLKIRSFDEEKVNLNANLIMSSYIAFYAFLLSVLIYFILSIIFFN